MGRPKQHCHDFLVGRQYERQAALQQRQAGAWSDVGHGVGQLAQAVPASRPGGIGRRSRRPSMTVHWSASRQALDGVAQGLRVEEGAARGTLPYEGCLAPTRSACHDAARGQTHCPRVPQRLVGIGGPIAPSLPIRWWETPPGPEPSARAAGGRRARQRPPRPPAAPAARPRRDRRGAPGRPRAPRWRGRLPPAPLLVVVPKPALPRP